MFGHSTVYYIHNPLCFQKTTPTVLVFKKHIHFRLCKDILESVEVTDSGSSFQASDSKSKDRR